MALQDDIMAMLSQISDAGDRATDRGRRGEELYGQIADRLSGNNRSKALREIAMLSSNPEMSIEEQMRFDPLTGSRVADIIEKYMDDVEDGVSTPVPDDIIVDDTRAAERMMEVMPSPDAAPRTPVSVEELPPMPRPELDEVAMASMAREFGGERQMNQERLREMGLSSLEGGAVPLRDRLMEGQGEPMSGTEQLMFASAFIPAAAIPQIGRILGMGASQIRNFLRAGDKGSEAMGQILQQRAKVMSADEIAEIRKIFRASELGQKAKPTAPMRSNGRFVKAEDIGPFPMTRTEQIAQQAKQFRQGLSQPAFKQGGNIRDKILKTYGGM